MNSIACWKMISAIVKKQNKTPKNQNNNTTTTMSPGVGQAVNFNGITQSQPHGDAALEQRPGRPVATGGVNRRLGWGDRPGSRPEDTE